MNLKTSEKRMRPCVLCKEPHLCGDGPTSGMCWHCYQTEYQEISKLSLQRTRARKVGLPYTLTLREWYETLEDFMAEEYVLCAYCQSRYATVIEHFIPIGLGGGTTKNNCVPACRGCNRKKHDRHPDEVANKFLPGTMQRVRAYLNQF